MCGTLHVNRSSQIPKYEAQRFKNAVQRYYKFFICANKNGEFGWWIGTFGNFCTLFGEKDTIEVNLEMENGQWKMDNWKKGGGNVASWRYNVIPSLRFGVVTTEQNGDMTRCGGFC